MFGDLEVIEDGSTLIIRKEAINPVSEAKENAGMVGDAGPLIQAAFRDLRIAFSIEAPFEIVEHNATERNGNRLSWIYTYDTLKQGEQGGVFVRYHR